MEKNPKFEKQLNNTLYQASLELPNYKDFFAVVRNLDDLIDIVPKIRKLPPADRDAFLQQFRQCLILMHNLVIGMHPYLLINQDQEIEVDLEDD